MENVLREGKSERQTDRERGREEEGEKRREIDKQIIEVAFSMLAMKWIQTQKTSNEMDPDSKEYRQTEEDKEITVYEDAKMMRQ